MINLETVPNTDNHIYARLQLPHFGLMVRLVGEPVRMRLQEFPSPLRRDALNINVEVLPFLKACADKSAPCTKVDDVHSAFAIGRSPENSATVVLSYVQERICLVQYSIGFVALRSFREQVQQYIFPGLRPVKWWDKRHPC